MPQVHSCPIILASNSSPGIAILTPSTDKAVAAFQRNNIKKVHVLEPDNLGCKIIEEQD